MASGPPEHHVDRLGRCLADRSCNFVLAAEKRLSGYDNIKKVTEADTGAKLSTLVRVSHIHMFGVPFIFFIVGLIFSHAYVRPVWFKCAVIALPFLSVMVDVSSWYMIKIYHPFAWVEILAGMLMAACFAFMWLVALYQMWFANLPKLVLERTGDIDVDTA